MTWTSQRTRGIQRLVLAVGLLALGLASFAAGQSQAINGTISGRVTDSSGATVTAAAVTVTNAGTGFTRTADSGSDGYYVLPNLPLGTYTVAIKKTGFATAQFSNVILNAGTNAVLNSALNVGAINQTVEVSSGAPVLDPAQVNIGATLDSRAITSLPLVSRNPYNFILFQPGVSGHPNPELGIPRTLNTNGLLDRINYQLDGMVDTESDRYGLRLFPISNAYIREVQTVSNSYAPEFGNTVGDIYNVITNSGTNTVHGMFNYTTRPSATAARPILLAASKPKPDLTQQDFNGNLGGPIKKNKLFLFGAYEHLRRGQPTPNTIDATAIAALKIPANLTATLPGVEHATFLDLRADYDINSSNQLMVRYNYFRNEYPFNSGAGGTNEGNTSSDFHDRAHIGGIQLVSEFGPTLVNELRASDPYRKEVHLAGPTTGPGPVISISGPDPVTFGGTTSNGTFFAEKVPSANDNLTWIHGAHTVKVGFSFQQNVDVQVNSADYNQWSFSSIANYQSGNYTTLTENVGNARQGYHTIFWGVFAQDSWQAMPSLLIDYGLRYDRYQPPPTNPSSPAPYSQHFATDTKDFAPRLGLAWKLDSKTVVRADGGIFYDAPPTNLWYNALYNDGSTTYSTISISNNTPGAPVYPNIPVLTPAASTPSIEVVSPTRRDTYVINGSLQVSRQLSHNDALTLGYVHTAGRELEYLYNSNLINPIGTLGDGRPIFNTAVNATTRLYPAYNAITMQATGANSVYDAMVVSYDHRWSRGVQVSAAYTWSHSLDNTPGANSFEVNSPSEDPTNRARDYGNSNVNRPNSLTLNTVIQPTFHLGRVGNALLNGNQFAFLASFASGDTQGITASSTQPLNGDSTTSGVQRPLGIGRNTLRTKPVEQVDLRYTRTLGTFAERLQPQFFLEAQNLLNRSNITSLNTKVAVAATGIPTNGIPASFPGTGTVLEARIIQFGFQVHF